MNCQWAQRHKQVMSEEKHSLAQYVTLVLCVSKVEVGKEDENLSWTCTSSRGCCSSRRRRLLNTENKKTHTQTTMREKLAGKTRADLSSLEKVFLFLYLLCVSQGSPPSLFSWLHSLLMEVPPLTFSFFQQNFFSFSNKLLSSLSLSLSSFGCTNFMKKYISPLSLPSLNGQEKRN